MGIVSGPSQHLVDPFDQALRDHVLELLGFVVDLRPAHAHDLDQERLDETMASEYEGRELLAR